ncbi:MAG: hypothetical protein AAGF83_05155 [Cyanobacteria bacterium P01_G01_bin.67]
MNQHYILNLDPQASSEWDRCVLRNPLTGERPNLTTEIAKAVNNQGGSYLVKVTLQVEILEQKMISQSKAIELSSGKKSLVNSDARLAS